ncbi:uncharacterized protein LOC130673393 [Microplitis mediator]|uniref:uncharacterized protein LOC130673393 n=1 Tax=Microplitis mediator TaxID=375433 RepID=UPI0025544AB6|nr:uncharacterized protein LOC130673393 [Microplitis mediator]
MHALWSDIHPNHSHFSQQHLRDYASHLRRTRKSLLNNRRLSHRLSFPAQLHQERRRSSEDADNDFERRQVCVSKKTHYSKDQLDTENHELSTRIQEDSTLLTINQAVYDAASSLLPPARNNTSSPEAKMKGRIGQLLLKIDDRRKHVSRIQCVIQYVNARKAFTPKVRRIAAGLRYQHDTLNKENLFNIKEGSINRLRALVTATKSLEKKLKRLTDNSLFRLSPSRFLTPKTSVSGDSPSIEQVEAFWSELYGDQPNVNRDTPALNDFEAFCRHHRNDNADKESPEVSVEKVRLAMNNGKNWAAPGQDGINLFWWKKLTSTHSHLARIFTAFIRGNEPIPCWLVEGRTVLIPKKGDLSDPKNYRPITCLNAVYKIFTKILNNRILQEIDPVWQQIYEQHTAYDATLANTVPHIMWQRQTCDRSCTV